MKNKNLNNLNKKKEATILTNNIGAEKVIKPTHQNKWLYLCTILLLTIIAYWPALKGEFLNWDDPDYVLNNLTIRSLGNIKQIFSTPIQGNYHPITMLSLAINYAISELNPVSYHVFNLLLHIANSILVFYFILKLTDNKFWISIFSAALFALHPLHVESVAWITERKDVMYALFFILGLIFYLNYLKTKSILILFLCFIFYSFSLLSKPAAVIFPVVLLTIDFYYERLKSLKTYLEKIPFLLMALIMGILTFQAQSAKGTITHVNFVNNFFTGFHGIMMYIFKTILPINLCTLYPYTAPNEPLPISYYFSVLFFIGLAITFIYFLKKERLIAFGILFFIVNLLLVLQFLPVGNAIMADRYTYVPIIGLFLIPGVFLQKWADSNGGKLPHLAKIGMILLCLILTFLSNTQSRTWVSTATIWDQAIKVNPTSMIYVTRGLIYKTNGDTENAIDLYNKALVLNSHEPEAFLNRGNIYFDQGKNNLAMADYRQAVIMKPIDPILLSNMAGVYARQNQLDSAMYLLNKAIKIDSTTKNAYSSRGYVNIQLKKYPEAIADYKRLILSDENNEELISNLIVCYSKLNNYSECLSWINKAIQINPNNSQYYFNRAFTYQQLGNKTNALADALQAKKMGYQVSANFMNSLK